MSAGKIVLLVFGVIILLVAVVMIFGGGALIWVDKALKDSEGFISTDTVRLESDSYAITTRPADIDFEGWWPWGRGDSATIKVEGSNNDHSKQIFIGVAEESDVKDYLSGVEYDEIREFRIHPYRVEYTNNHGTSEPAVPTSQTFWRVSTHGPGTKTLTWELEEGSWVLMLMNADGSADVDLDVAVGIKVPWILGLGIGLLIGGIVALIIAIVMIYFAVRKRQVSGGMGVAGAGTGEAPIPEARPPYPLSFKGELTEPLSQWLWLVKWFLLIPHYIVLIFLWVAFVVVWIISLFAILFTSKYPRSLFDFSVGVLRWTWRVGFYGYQALGTDKYPPFTLKAGGYPADLEVPYPEKLTSGLVLVKWWLLAIPHYIVLSFFWSFGHAWGRWIGLTFILVLFAAVVLLLTGRYPKGIFNLVLGMNRWSYRVATYSGLMTDRYPPFRLGD